MYKYKPSPEYVYFIAPYMRRDLLKIGFSSDPNARAKQLDGVCVAWIELKQGEGRPTEQALHDRLGYAHVRREYFDASACWENFHRLMKEFPTFEIRCFFFANPSVENCREDIGMFRHIQREDTFDWDECSDEDEVCDPRPF